MSAELFQTSSNLDAVCKYPIGSVILALTLKRAIEWEAYVEAVGWFSKLEESAVIKCGKPYNTLRVVSVIGLLE